MRGPALAAIGAYQRHVSPYKGFCCAYRTHTGRASCSTLGARVIRRHGMFKGLLLLRERLRRCGEVYRLHHSPAYRTLTAQRGDLDCGDCDLSGCDVGDALDLSDCCDCSGCGSPGSATGPSPRRRRKRGEGERPESD